MSVFEHHPSYGTAEHWAAFVRSNTNLATKARYVALYGVEPPNGSREWFPATETVTLANGQAVQALVPGVEPVSVHTAALAREHAKRMAKRRHEPMQAGGLFDDVARAQQSLF